MDKVQCEKYTIVQKRLLNILIAHDHYRTIAEQRRHNSN